MTLNLNTKILGPTRKVANVNADGSLDVSVVSSEPVALNEFNYDAFGRFRFASPATLFDSKQIFDNSPLFWNDAETSGGGTGSSHSTDLAASTMTVGASTVGTRVRQTKRRFNYQPGKSQLILMTGVMGAGAAGITRRIGYFDANNGLFFQLSGTTLSVVRRSYVTGSPVDVAVAQSSWNMDKMDGTGVSGVTLDMSKTQIFLIDFEWLGVGRVRFGFVVDGAIYYCHQLLNANVLSTVYMSTPNLPVRYEISNDGTGGAASLIHICASVMSEGGQEDTGLVRSSSTGNTHLDANTGGTVYAMIGLRLKSTHLGATVKNIYASFLGATVNDYFEWLLVLNPTLGAALTYSDVTNSALQVAKGATANTVTGGTLLASGFVRAQADATVDISNSLLLGSLINGTPDEIILCVRPLGSGAINLDVYGSITWRELL